MERHKPKYGIFIIESMDLDNERNGNLDGYALKTILDLCGIPNDYYYIRTIYELEVVIEKFRESDFGFLHIACHGNEEALSLSFEDIGFEELEYIIGKHLKYRRLFLSACRLARFELAKFFIPKNHAYSVIGTPDDIDYDKAAIFWSSFYYLMYKNDRDQMYQINILPTIEVITKTFNLKLNYFSIIRESSTRSMSHVREIHFDNGLKVFDKMKDTGFVNQFR